MTSWSLTRFNESLSFLKLRHEYGDATVVGLMLRINSLQASFCCRSGLTHSASSRFCFLAIVPPRGYATRGPAWSHEVQGVMHGTSSSTVLSGARLFALTTVVSMLNIGLCAYSLLVRVVSPILILKRCCAFFITKCCFWLLKVFKGYEDRNPS